MDYMHTIIMGFMQGLTEFLPVSSSGHIVLTSVIYKMITGQDFTVAGEEEVFFDIMLHLGTLIAVCIYFRKEIVIFIKSFFTALKTRNFNNYRAMLPVYIVTGTFFTCCVAYPISDFCETLLTRPVVVGGLLMITGIILLISEKLSNRIEVKSTEVNFKKSILIGIAQGLAIFPGISRSGSTIATALACGVGRVNAARYSFLLSIPVILIAVVYESKDILDPAIYSNLSWGPILAGAVVAGVVGYLCIKYFIIFLNRFSLNAFGYYCLAIGLSAIIYFKFFA
ncbi:MAG: undecaprenyl-diphosphate phosphatase [Candidatus Gastranaerophilales bacterium]|nr:undecaprenyl-diphosphate phosphatase [Candidatus Gastranaerophilales bacterium]